MGSSALILYALCILIAICNSSTLYTDVIETQSGPVRGVIRTNVLSKANYSAFIGIPYAKPPLAKLRFLPPVEMEPWKDVWEATYFRNMCPQIVNKQYLGEEDCLYLNVYTPGTVSNSMEELKPVIVWIHGGAFSMGTGASVKYGPDFLLDKDVILVTFNYRLGAIGFMNLGHEMIPGNAGLKDQNMVLRWVKKNIASFGGDPNKVTLFGQSAGGVSVDLHNIAKVSKNLYQRSIAMSGSVFCPWGFMSLKKAEKNALLFAKKISGGRYYHKESVVESLLSLPARKLIENAKTILFQVMDMELEFVPSIEKRFNNSEPFIDDCFLNEYKKGDFNKGDHIMGFTSLEAGMVVEKASQKLLPTWLWQFFGKSVLHSPLKEVSSLVFTNAIDAKQGLLSTISPKSSIYYYLFDYVGINSLVKGAYHTEDLLYIFYRADLNQSLEYLGKDNFEYDGLNPDAAARNRIVTMFTNFAKMREPNYQYNNNFGYQTFVWNASTVRGGYLRIAKELSMQAGRPVQLNDKMMIDSACNSQ